MRCISFVLLAVLALPAFAWGPDGHRIVCRIAWLELSEEQREEVDRLARLYRRHGADFTSFPHSCNFADSVRRRDPFRAFDDTHFLNLPRSERRVSLDFCPGTCVLKGITGHSQELRDADNDLDRAEALFFLGHWLGDIHQPLHISFEDDRGGNGINEIRGGFFRSGDNDLHKVWDSGILLKIMGESWGDFADAIAEEITDEDRAAWITATPEEMAQESYDISTSREALYCRMDGGECESMGPRRTLRRSYHDRFDHVVERRLQQAGVRLAEAIRRNLAAE